MERIRPAEGFDTDISHSQFRLLSANDRYAALSDASFEKLSKQQDRERVIFLDGEKGAFDAEFDNIAYLRKQFDEEVGIDTRGKLLSWDAVKSRNRFEQCQTADERRAYRRNEIKELTSTLRERYTVLESPMDFFFDTDGKLYNREFPTDPLETILERGVAYQEANGSKEGERERSEVIGVRKIQEKFSDPSIPSGTKMVILSPPGLIEGSPYTKRFVDIYELREDPDTQQRTVHGTRLATTMTLDEYREKALLLDPAYFDEEAGPFDAYLLRNPIEVSQTIDIEDLLEQVFDRDPHALTEAEFEYAIYRICLPYMIELVRELCRDEFNPQIIANYFNAMLHKGDLANKLLRNGWTEELERMIKRSTALSPEEIREESYRLGNIPVETVAVGCGESSGYFSNSVGQFGMRPEDDPNLCKKCPGAGPHFHCPGTKIKILKDKDGNTVRTHISCDEKIIVGRNITRCPTCGEGRKC